jgi:hypothetical protein
MLLFWRLGLLIVFKAELTVKQWRQGEVFSGMEGESTRLLQEE